MLGISLPPRLVVIVTAITQVGLSLALVLERASLGVLHLEFGFNIPRDSP